MKIMRLSDGMANTMFQYAAYLQLKKMYPDEEIYVDTMWFDITKYPYDLKKAFGLEVKDFDFYDIAKKEKRINYETEFEQLRNWKEFGYSSWIGMIDSEMAIQGKISARDFPEIYLKAGYKFDIVLASGYTLNDAYRILKGELKVEQPPMKKILIQLKNVLGQYNRIFMYERAIRLPDKRKKLFYDIIHGRKPDFTGSPQISRLRYDGNAYYCTYGNVNDLCGIEDEIRNVFSFVPFKEENNISVAEDIVKHESVAIHARVSAFEYGMDAAVKRDYYKKAVRYIEKKIGKDVKYYVFSDRPQWVRQHLDMLGLDREKEYCIVDNNNGTNAFRDMQLMSLCKHIICAQSTFSWWAGFLNSNPNRILITPYETLPGTISF